MRAAVARACRSGCPMATPPVAPAALPPAVPLPAASARRRRRSSTRSPTLPSQSNGYRRGGLAPAPERGDGRARDASTPQDAPAPCEPLQPVEAGPRLACLFSGLQPLHGVLFGRPRRPAPLSVRPYMSIFQGSPGARQFVHPCAREAVHQRRGLVVLVDRRCARDVGDQAEPNQPIRALRNSTDGRRRGVDKRRATP